MSDTNGPERVAPATTSAGRTPAVRPGAVWTAAALDVACVLGFSIGGRSAHDEALSLAGVLTVAWPFLVGLVAGWLVARSWLRPLAVWPTGAVACTGTWAVGHALRAATGGGEAVGFLIVSALFLAATTLGWRLVATLLRARRDG